MRAAGDVEAAAVTDSGGDGPDAPGEADPRAGAQAEARLATRRR
jgi:hypothetical protein